jgi:hypothetical protein
VQVSISGCVTCLAGQNPPAQSSGDMEEKLGHSENPVYQNTHEQEGTAIHETDAYFSKTLLQ